MNRLEELIKNPKKFNLSNEAIDSLRELFVTFERTHFSQWEGMTMLGDT